MIHFIFIIVSTKLFYGFIFGKSLIVFLDIGAGVDTACIRFFCLLRLLRLLRGFCGLWILNAVQQILPLLIERVPLFCTLYGGIPDAVPLKKISSILFHFFVLCKKLLLKALRVILRNLGTGLDHAGNILVIKEIHPYHHPLVR